MKKRVFICFDYDKDRNYRYLLSALEKNERNDLLFEDVTPEEVQSSSVAAIKRALSRRINVATHTLVVVGAGINRPHSDRLEIGEKNWQHWEIKASKIAGNRLIGVKLPTAGATPEALLRSSVSFARSFSVSSIIAAVDAK